MRIQPQGGQYAIIARNTVLFQGTFKECIAEVKAIIKLGRLFKLIEAV